MTCLVVGFDIQLLGRLTSTKIYVFLDWGETRSWSWKSGSSTYAYGQPVSMRDLYSRRQWRQIVGAGQLGVGVGMVVGSRH